MATHYIGAQELKANTLWLGRWRDTYVQLTPLHPCCYGGASTRTSGHPHSLTQSVDFSRPARASHPVAAPACLEDLPNPTLTPRPYRRPRARPVCRHPARRTPFPGARAVPPSLPTCPDSLKSMKDVQHETLEYNISMQQIKHLKHTLATHV